MQYRRVDGPVRPAQSIRYKADHIGAVEGRFFVIAVQQRFDPLGVIRDVHRSPPVPIIAGGASGAESATDATGPAGEFCRNVVRWERNAWEVYPLASASLWEESIQLPSGFLSDLETFITRQETRKADVFWQHELMVGPGLTLQIIVKHDLFEGVVLHLTLLDTEAYRFVAGHDVSIKNAEQALGSFEVVHQGATYRIHLHT